MMMYITTNTKKQNKTLYETKVYKLMAKLVISSLLFTKFASVTWKMAENGNRREILSEMKFCTKTS